MTLSSALSQLCLKKNKKYSYIKFEVVYVTVNVNIVVL